MRSSSQTFLMSLAEAMAQMLETVQSVEEVELVPLEAALDRVLAGAMQAPVDVPAYDNSAMDGYALQASDSHALAPLQLIGSALAGRPFAGEVKPGTCVRITTGAVIPAGADCVVMQENTHDGGDWVTINQGARQGENLRLRGEDISEGEAVLAAGQRLGPVQIGLLASLGIDRVRVYRRLRVAILSTGDELTRPGQPLPKSHIYDSNRYAITALLKRAGMEVVDLGLQPDEPDAIGAAVSTAAREADAIISSGGVSVGEADHVKQVLAELGSINFWKIAVKPGKPFAFGRIGESVFFGLPGNPVSAMVTLHQLALPTLRHMAGEPVIEPLILTARAATPLRKRPGRTDYQRGNLVREQRENMVYSSGAQASGLLTSFTGANCYIVLERDRGAVEAGEMVKVIPFDQFI